MSIERKVAPNNNGFPTTTYGSVTIDELAQKGSAIGGSGDKHKYDVEFVVDVASGTIVSDSDPSVYTLPEGSFIEQAEVVVLEPLSGGSNFVLGLSQPSGTVIDADGLLEASTASAAGSVLLGDGALVGTQVSTPSQLTLGGTRTAGKIAVRVRYLRATL